MWLLILSNRVNKRNPWYPFPQNVSQPCTNHTIYRAPVSKKIIINYAWQWMVRYQINVTIAVILRCKDMDDCKHPRWMVSSQSAVIRIYEFDRTQIEWYHLRLLSFETLYLIGLFWNSSFRVSTIFFIRIQRIACYWVGITIGNIYIYI